MIYTAIDFETADNGKDSACAVGLVKMQDTCIIDSFYRLIRPPRSWIKYAYFHGITWDMLKNQPNFAEQWHDIEAFLKGTEAFIAHNAQFDKGVLYGTANAYAIRPPEIPFYCTLKGSRKFLQLQKNSLDYVCSALQINLQHHHALSDAAACAEIFIHFHKQGFQINSCLLQ